ncbi:MAG: hypothetical protein NZZ41_02980 [Candidatus Dojkabacteria bacterium]|nr:hypothetical protein [Candidatus Dojkabacteria bacterium]
MKFFYNLPEGSPKKQELLRIILNYVANKGYETIKIDSLLSEKFLNKNKSENVLISFCTGEGSRGKRKDIYDFFISKKFPVIIIDRNYFCFDRLNTDHSSIRIQLNSLYEEETEILYDKPIENRWKKMVEKYNLELKPWRKNGDYIMVMINNTSGNMNSSKAIYDYYSTILNTIPKYTKRKILLFTHSAEICDENTLLRNIIFDRNKVEFFYKKDFSAYLKNCWAFVTRNSSSSLYAIINGIPIFVSNKKQPFSVSLGLTDLSKIEEPYMPENREEILNMLSHRIWFKNEIDIFGEKILNKLKQFL